MYAVAYTVHEVVHLHPLGGGHHEQQRVVERTALRYWGINAIRYGRVYCEHFATAYGHELNRCGDVIKGNPW